MVLLVRLRYKLFSTNLCGSMDTLQRIRAEFGTGPLARIKEAADEAGVSYWTLVTSARGKHPNVVVVAVARELAGFVWDIARRVPIAATA